MYGFTSLFSRNKSTNRSVTSNRTIKNHDYESFYLKDITEYKKKVENNLINETNENKAKMKQWFIDIYNLEMRFKYKKISEKEFKNETCNLKYKSVYGKILNQINQKISLPDNKFFNFLKTCEVHLTAGKSRKRRANKKKKHTRRRKI